MGFQLLLLQFTVVASLKASSFPMKRILEEYSEEASVSSLAIKTVSTVSFLLHKPIVVVELRI